MKIILAGMAAVIVILVVALGAALVDKVDILIQEEPTRAVPNPKPAFTQDENRQRQSQNQQRQKEELENEARRECERNFGTWDFLQKTCVTR